MYLQLKKCIIECRKQTILIREESVRMKNASKRRLKIMTALSVLAVIFFTWSVPAFSEENTKPAEVTHEEMDKAYDEAMMQGDSEITFLTMEEVNYWLAVIMKFTSGKMTDEDYAELKNPEVKRILDLDELIAQSDSFFKETGIQIDLSEYEDAVSSWEEYMEGLSGNTESAAADELFGQLPLESRADYLEAAYNVDNAIWTAIKSALGDSWSEVTDLVSGISPYVEKGEETVSGAFTLIDKIKTIVSVGNDEARYEKRIGLQNIKTRFTLLQQILHTVCNVIEAVPSF